jgi:hypothetical protein
MGATNGQVRILNANQLLLYYKTQAQQGGNFRSQKMRGSLRDANGIKKQFNEFKKLINSPENQLSRAYTALEKMYLQQDKILGHEKEEKSEQTRQSAADEEQTPNYTPR